MGLLGSRVWSGWRLKEMRTYARNYKFLAIVSDGLAPNKRDVRTLILQGSPIAIHPFRNST